MYDMWKVISDVHVDAVGTTSTYRGCVFRFVGVFVKTTTTRLSGFRAPRSIRMFEVSRPIQRS